MSVCYYYLFIFSLAAIADDFVFVIFVVVVVVVVVVVSQVVMRSLRWFASTAAINTSYPPHATTSQTSSLLTNSRPQW